MINRATIQKALAIIAALALVVGTVQLVSLLVQPAKADASTNIQNILPHYGPIGDLTNDPFTTNFPRPDSVGHSPELTNNRVALVFNFEPSYAWETMGGTYWGYKDKQQHRNFDQSDQIIQMLNHLKGAPVSVGVYTFHRARSANGVSPNNTPNLKATSLENKDGFDKVVAKLRTLDATDGQGERMKAEDGSNFQWGLKQIRNDMEAYEQHFRDQYGHAPAQPLYNNILVFTTGLGYCYGDSDNEKCRPVLDRKDAENAAYTEADAIAKKGAHVNFLAMGPSYYNDNRRMKFLTTLAQKTGGKITIIKHNIYGYGAVQGEGLPNYDYYHYQDPRDTSLESWYAKKEPAHNTQDYRESLRQACNLLNPYTDGEPSSPYNLTEQRCNHVRDGKFADTVEDYLFKEKGLEITADAVDENLVYLNPIASTKFGVTTNNGGTEELSTGTDGIIEKPTNGVTSLRIVPRLDKDKYALTRLRLREGNYSAAKLPAEANARCVGFSKKHLPTVFSPTTFAPGTDPANRGGIQIESLHLEAYTYIKCGFYHRPMQESVLRKSVKVGNEQIRFDVMKSQFQVDWSCKDPYAIENQGTPFVTGTKDLLLAKQNPDDPNITLNTEYSFPDMPLGTTGTDGKTRMPVGAMCQVNSSVKYPHRCYGTDQSSGCQKPWAKTDWDHLMTVDDKLEHSQYFEVKATESAPPPASYDYGFKASGEQLTKPASADPEEKSILETRTTFTSKKASVKVRVNFTNESHDPAYNTLDKPSTVPVYYNCRYMGDPTRPPEIPESNASAMPGYVELGAIDVPTNGTDFYELGIKRDPATHEPILDEHGNTIPTWPVGTHCLFTSLPPADAPGTATSSPWSVPGFNITDSYASTVCASRWNQHDTGEQACSNNYFWVNSQGEKSITLTQDIVRNNAQMTFTKTVSGDAQHVGRNQTFTENLSCKQNGVDIPTGTTSFSAQADVPVTVTVPAAATCTITEEDLTGISDDINVTKPSPKTFGSITDTSTPLPVTTDTKFVYRTAAKRVEHVSAFDANLSDTSLQEALRGLDKTVTATCLKPGVTEPEVITKTITGDGTVNLGTLPATTTCAFKTTVQGLDDLATQKDAQNQPLYPDASLVIATSTVNPDTTTVDLDGTVAAITTTYKLQVAGAITVTTASTETLPYNSLKQLLPTSYNYTINCGKGELNVTLDRDGAVKELTGQSEIPPNTQCTLTQATTNDTRLTRTTTMTPSNGSPSTHTSGDTGNPVLTFTSPAANGTLNINIVNDYAVAYTKLMLSTSTDVKTSADAQTPATIEVPTAWKTPLFTHQTDISTTTSDYKVRAELVCANGSDEYKIAGDFTVNAEGWQLPAPLTVPVGWNCQIDLNQPLFKIPGADLVDSDGKALSADATSGANFTWNAVGAEGTVSNQVGLTGALVTQAGSTADANSLALHIPYRMQLGSFNFKKKVGGEGVSMIPGSHQFKVDYSCSLNGVDIPIPAARTIAEKQNVTATLGDDLSERLTALENQRSMEMGRFQQGEWHPIDALPAGAVCAVSEDATKAEREYSKWDNYWELTPGFRSREPIVSNCETKGTELCSYRDSGSKSTALVKLPRDAGAKKNEFWSKDDNPADSSNPIVPKTLPENFAGTMVPWNNYTFEKTQVKVNLTIDGNGKRLGAGKTVMLRLYCKPPTLVANGVAIPNNAGNAAAIYNTPMPLTPSKSDPYTATATSDVFVPVGYNCVLAETRPEPYDATVGYQLHRVSTDTSTVLTDDIPADTPNPLTTLKGHLATLFGDIDVNGGTVDGVTYKPDGNLLPAQNEGILKGFRVHPDHVSAQGATQEFTEFDLTNTYTRPEANLWVNALVDNTTTSTYEENVGSQLGALAYKVNYTCTDAYLRNPAQPPATEGAPVTYTGTVTVDSSGNAVQIKRDSEDILPATATCAFTLENAGTDPIASYPTLRHRLGADWREVMVPGSTEVHAEAFQPKYMDDKYPCPTETDPDKQCPTQKSDLTQYRNAKGVTLDPTGQNQTTITFTNTYLVQKADIGVVAYPQGDRAKQYLPTNTTYGYTYSCDYPTLPGYTSPGSGILQYEDTSVTPATVGNAKAAQLASTIVPVGSTCTIVPQAPSANLDNLADAGLTRLTALMTPPRNQLIDPATGLPRTEPTFSDVPKADGTGIEWSAAARAEIPDTGFTMTAGDDPRVVLHTIYRDKAKVQIRKVDKDQQPVDKGAIFKIYPVDTDGNPVLTEGIEVSAQMDTGGSPIPGVFAAMLAPGGYVLEETKSGMGEMLPTYWPFTVNPTNHQDTGADPTFDPYTDFGEDLTVELADYVSHTGLVAVRTPANDTQPWSIDVAEVSSGYLPKTGGARLWVEITGLLVLAGGLALAYRRKTFLKENH